MSTACRLLATAQFNAWRLALRDPEFRHRLAKRLQRLTCGNPGLRRVLGDGLWELKIDCGPGYRVYCKTYGEAVVLLLAGGHKGTQSRDIEQARRLAIEWEKRHDT